MSAEELREMNIQSVLELSQVRLPKQRNQITTIKIKIEKEIKLFNNFMSYLLFSLYKDKNYNNLKIFIYISQNILNKYF